MNPILLWAAVFAASLFVVVKSAGAFIEYARKLGLRFGIPPFILGLTVVAMGTSLPELATSLAGVLRGLTQLPIDNIVGSNIANILLIIGITAIVARVIVIRRDLINLDLPLLAASQALLVLVIWDGKVTLFEGILSVLLMAVYLHYAVKGHGAVHHEKATAKDRQRPILPLVLGTAASLAFLVVASEFTIRGLTNLAGALNIATSFLSITALAVGTSLPELIVTLLAITKGQHELGTGNIVGSNIFNGAFILGVAALVKPLTVSAGTLALGIPYLAAATLLLIFSGISRRIHNWEGAMFLIVYALFISQLVAAL
jgi:cation:H+ antiporter